VASKRKFVTLCPTRLGTFLWAITRFTVPPLFGVAFFALSFTTFTFLAWTFFELRPTVEAGNFRVVGFFFPDGD
jgi:hypothetical protein